MSRLSFLASWVACVLLAACGGGGGGGGGNTDPADLDLYVDAVNGDDVSGDGTSENPFKSITRGVQRAGLGDKVIRVARGTYDEANGELFPIVPGMGVAIVGTEIQGPLGIRRLTQVVGGGFWSGDPQGRLHATIVPNVDNRLVSLAIENPQPFVVNGAKPAAVVLANAGVTIESCTLRDSDKGMRMVGGAHDTLTTNCLIGGNGIGIFVDGAGAFNRVEGCLVQGNVVGVELFSPGADFGGDLAGGQRRRQRLHRELQPRRRPRRGPRRRGLRRTVLLGPRSADVHRRPLPVRPERRRLAGRRLVQRGGRRRSGLRPGELAAAPDRPVIER
jgi:hypothetical protein